MFSCLSFAWCFLVTVQCLLFTTSASNTTSTSHNATCLLKLGYNIHIRCGQQGQWARCMTVIVGLLKVSEFFWKSAMVFGWNTYNHCFFWCHKNHVVFSIINSFSLIDSFITERIYLAIVDFLSSGWLTNMFVCFFLLMRFMPSKCYMRMVSWSMGELKIIV